MLLLEAKLRIDLGVLAACRFADLSQIFSTPVLLGFAQRQWRGGENAKA